MINTYPLSSASNPIINEDSIHARIEMGDTFVHNNAHTGIAAGASYFHVMDVGDEDLHLTQFRASSTTSPIWIEVAEGDTYTGGTAGEIVNRDRNSVEMPVSTITEGVTISVGGTHLVGDYSGGTKQSGGSVSTAEEWVLKRNTTYAFEVRNDSSSSADVSFHLEWYISR